jgi:hypothetical protein
MKYDVSNKDGAFVSANGLRPNSESRAHAAKGPRTKINTMQSRRKRLTADRMNSREWRGVFA